MKTYQKSILASLIATTLAACGGGDSDTPTPAPINQAPKLTVSNLSAKETTAINIVASASDADGTIASFSWVQKSGSTVALSGQNSGALSFVAPSVSEDQKLVFTLTVTDNQGATASQDVEVTILNNRLPEIALADVTIKEGEVTSISAVVSDSDGGISKLAWTQKSGPAATIVGADSHTLSVTAPAITADQELVFTLVATDSDGESSSRDVKVTVLANMLALTLKGRVTDNPVADAKVTVEVAGQRIEVVADSQGSYAADINVDDSFADALVKVTAVGPEANSKTKLISLLGDVASLLDSAGDDKVLTKDEAFAVNVTNVTTAVHALMKLANGGDELNSKSAFDTAQKGYDAGLVMPLATAIKLVLDYAGQYPDLGLPEGVTDVAALVADLTLVSQYLNQAMTAQAAVYAEALIAIAEDAEVVAASSVGVQIAGRYYFTSKESSLSADRMSFSAGGSGEFVGFFSASAFSWNDTNEGTLVTYPGKGMLESIGYYQVPGIQGQTKVERYRTASLIKWLQNSDKSAQLLIKHFTTSSYPEAQLPDVTDETDFFSVAAVKEGGLSAPADLIRVGATYSMSIPERDITIDNAHERVTPQSWQRTLSFTVSQDNRLTLNQKQHSGDGSESSVTIPASYSVTDAGTLKILPDDNSVLSLDVALFTSPTQPKVNVLASDSRAGGGYLLEKSGVKWSASNIPGIYDLGWSFFGPMDYFWIELYADGRALTVSTSDRNQDQQLSANEFSLMPGRWQLNDSGELSIRRYRINRDINMTSGQYCEAEQWDTSLSDECVLYNDRIWDLYSVKDGRYYMTNTHKFYLDYAGKRVLGDVPVDQHILLGISDSNRSWLKVGTRPVAFPADLGVQSDLPVKPKLQKAVHAPWSHGAQDAVFSDIEAPDSAVIDQR